MEFKVHTEYSIYNDGYSMAILREVWNGTRSFVQPFTLKSYPEHSAVPQDEAFCLRDEFGRGSVKSFLQSMMDAAWEFGLRPKAMKDQKDELAAVRYHLEDMRRLALEPPAVTVTHAER